MLSIYIYIYIYICIEAKQHSILLSLKDTIYLEKNENSSEILLKVYFFMTFGLKNTYIRGQCIIIITIALKLYIIFVINYNKIQAQPFHFL